MRIAVLGPLEVRDDDGATLAVPGVKERLLLAVLVAGAPGVVSTDSIMEALWNGDAPASARKSLQVHLVHLRNALEPGRPAGSTGRYVVRRGTGYALAATREEVDALCVADLAMRGRARLASGDARDAERSLTTAIDLWRGEPYGDWPDAAFARAERRRLAEVRTAAVTAWIEARLALGEHAPVVAEIESLLVENPLQEDWWRLLVLALYRSGRQGDALAAVARARTVLVEELGAEPGPRLRAVEAAVLAQDPALELPAGTAARPTAARRHPDLTACPYKGLAAYQTADAALFHGRGRIVTHLVARLVDTPLLVISGSSGAGKSSLVRAGLIPALAAGALPGSAGWAAVVLRPGRRPVDALAQLTGRDAPDSPTLLVCDQMEELWAPDVDPPERTAFLDTLLGLLDDGIVVRVVAVVRGDHVGRLAEHAAFTERLAGALVLAPALTDEELREVVREPAAAVGLAVDSELLDAVVADVLGRPAALPLLSTALVGTWERRRGERLTLAGYLEAGGVEGALARSAEAAYDVLDADGRETARRLLVRLAETDDGGALVRRPRPLAELDLDDASRRAVADTFVDRRLLVVDGQVLDLAHEALLTAWPRLVRWLEDDAVGRAVRSHLAPAAQEWQRRGEAEDELLRGARLAAALDWADGVDGDPTGLERRFLDASRARADAELGEAQLRARAEARGRRRLRRLSAGLAAVLVVALGTAVLAVRAQRAADRVSLIADANRLAALSGTAESLDLTYLLAAQGFRLRDTPETRDALLASLVEHRRVIHTETSDEGPLGALADGGRTVFVGNHFTGRILTWPVDSEDPPRVVLEPDESWEGWRATAASPTEAVVLAAGTGGSGPWVRTVDADGAVREVLGGAAVGGEPISAVVLPDGRRARLLVAGTDGETATWRLVEIDLVDGTGREIAVLGTTPADPGDLKAELSADGTAAVLVDVPRRSVAFADLETNQVVPLEAPTEDQGTFFEFRALPTGAVLLGSEGTVTLYDTDGRIRQQFDALPGAAIDLDVAPDGTWGVTVGAASGVVLWDIDAATGRWSEKEVLTGAGGIVGTAMIDPSGTRLYTLSSNAMLMVWDVTPSGGFGAPRPGLAGRWVTDEPAVVAPGELVVVPTRPFGTAVPGDWPYFGPGTSEVAATFVDPRTGEVVDEVAVGSTLEESWTGASVAVSPDRGLIAVNSGLAVTVLDARSREPVTTFSVPAAGYPGPDGQPLPVGVIGCLAWAADGSRLLVGVQGANPDTSPGGGTLVAVDTDTWQVVDEATVGVVPEALELSPDGRTVALGGGRNRALEIRDAASLDERSTVELAMDDRLADLSWSQDGGQLLAAGEGGGLHVVDTDTWQASAPPLASDAARLQIEWLPDGRTVALTGAGTTVRLFDVERSVARSGLPAALGNLVTPSFMVPDPTDDLVLLSDQDRVMSYPMTPSAWLRAACAIAGRDLTRAEWGQYLPGRPYATTCSDLA